MKLPTFNRRAVRVIAGIAAVFVAVAAAHTVGAEVTYTLNVPFPGAPTIVTGPGQYIKTLYLFGVGFGSVLAIAMIVVGAIRWTTSEVITNKEDAKEQITQALLGLALLLAAALIVKFINPELTIENLPDKDAQLLSPP